MCETWSHVQLIEFAGTFRLAFIMIQYLALVCRLSETAPSSKGINLRARPKVEDGTKANPRACLFVDFMFLRKEANSDEVQ